MLYPSITPQLHSSHHPKPPSSHPTHPQPIPCLGQSRGDRLQRDVLRQVPLHVPLRPAAAGGQAEVAPQRLRHAVAVAAETGEEETVQLAYLG